MTKKLVEQTPMTELTPAELAAVSGGIIIVGGLAADFDGDWCGTKIPRFPIPPRPRFDLAQVSLPNVR